jgi:TniQ
VSITVPLPLAPPPYRAEAINSWLTRVATPYSLKPRQLLRALHVKPFDGPTVTHPQSSLEVALDTHSRKQLARLARCDPSRLRRTDTSDPLWMLANDSWVVFCPRCISRDIQSGAVAYERSLWRVATRTVCVTHRCCLRMAKRLPSAAEQCEWLIEPMTELELAVIHELIRFERLVAVARRGSTITLGGITLTADSFVSIFRDLTTYCIENWDTRDYRRVCLVERQVMRLGGHMTRLFSRERKQRTPHRRRNENQGLIHMTDPAVRRLAIWLTLQVIACPATPARLSLMRLGRSPQVDFLGPWEHEGFAWLADRAKNWPADYRALCWPQFLPPGAINEGTVPSIKVLSATK